MANHYLQTVLAIFEDAVFHRQLLKYQVYITYQKPTHIFHQPYQLEIIETDFDQTLGEINTSL